MYIRCGTWSVTGAILANLTGCGSNSVGTWDGDCDASADGQALNYELQISVDEVKGGEVKGEGEVSIDGFSDEGDLEGEVEGKDIEWTFEVEDNAGEYEINLEGTFDDGDTISGDCEVRQISGGNFLAKGDFELRRD